ncbi:21990_t:CDS:2 [Gigaspora rosea]|nr:21990_t:CDS:2 [Gigaspora rosea]
MVDPKSRSSSSKLDQAKPYVRPSSSSKAASVQSSSSKSINKALDEFHRIYDFRLTTSCDFLIWRTYNQVYLPVTNLKEELNNYFATRRQYEEWSEEDKEINKEGHFTQWKYLYENEYIDIGNTFAKTITWDLIKALEYDDPLLSFIIDFTKSQDELKSKVPPVVFNYAAHVPNHYYDLPTQEFENLFNKFYSNRRNW